MPPATSDNIHTPLPAQWGSDVEPTAPAHMLPREEAHVISARSCFCRHTALLTPPPPAPAGGPSGGAPRRPLDRVARRAPHRPLDGAGPAGLRDGQPGAVHGVLGGPGHASGRAGVIGRCGWFRFVGLW